MVRRVSDEDTLGDMSEVLKAGFAAALQCARNVIISVSELAY